MDYIPVYEGEEQDDGKTVKVTLDKVQRSGVRTEAVEARVIVRPVRAVGTVMHDESRLTIVAMRSDAYIEELFVNKTGQHVHVGDPLFRVFSPDIVSAQVDLRNGGAEQRLRNLGVPESHIREVRAASAEPREGAGTARSVLRPASGRSTHPSHRCQAGSLLR
jgi:membrane fusion protein, copper/silver efflux system